MCFIIWILPSSHISMQKLAGFGFLYWFESVILLCIDWFFFLSFFVFSAISLLGWELWFLRLKEISFIGFWIWIFWDWRMKILGLEAKKVYDFHVCLTILVFEIKGYFGHKKIKLTVKLYWVIKMCKMISKLLLPKILLPKDQLL